MAFTFSPTDRNRMERTSDFVIKTGTKEIKCHKLKLALHSEVFDKMFQHDCNENRKNEVLIDDFEEETVEDFVDFLYQGKLAEGTKYTSQLLSIGHKYQVMELVDTCSDYLQDHLTRENVAEAWVASETFEISRLNAAVHEFLAKNWTLRGKCCGIDDVIKNHPEYMVSLVQTMQEATEALAQEKREASEALAQKTREHDAKERQLAEKESELSDMRRLQRFARCHAFGHKVQPPDKGSRWTSSYTLFPCRDCDPCGSVVSINLEWK